MPVRIKPEQAALGMYVQGFDGTWFSHPFWRAQFVIRSEADLLRIRDSGADLFIDPAKGVTVELRDEPRVDSAVTPLRGAGAVATRSTLPVPLTLRRPGRMPRRVAPPAFGKADEARATALAQRSTKVVRELFDDCRLGRSINTPQILEVVRDIADTLERSGTAFASVTRLRAKEVLSV